MPWDDTTWDAFCAIVAEAWPGTFDDAAAASWRVLLDPMQPQIAIEAIRRLMFEGHKFRPSASEVLAAARRDPSKPTFDEAYQMLYGARGVLLARACWGTNSPARWRRVDRALRRRSRR